ncbi:hypothetical protein PM168_10930, partial [Escherichia coli]|nr:hypothetical protein [Escherichia coli]
RRSDSATIFDGYVRVRKGRDSSHNGTPFIIDKDSGEIHSLGTAKPLEEYLQDYEIKKATFGLP